MIQPVAHWTGNDTANDSSGNSRNLTITSAAYTTGNINRAFDVSNANTAGEVASFETMGGTRQYLSAFAWVKSTSALTTSLVILAKYDTGNQRQWRMDLNGGTVADGVFRILLSSNGTSAGKDYRGYDDWTDGNWHHVGFTYNNGVVTAYHNGAEYTMNKVGDSAMTSLYNSTSKVGMGCNFASGSKSSIFVGQIEDARIYDSVLTAAQISDIYNAGYGTYLNVIRMNGSIPLSINGTAIANIKTVNGIGY